MPRLAAVVVAAVLVAAAVGCHDQGESSGPGATRPAGTAPGDDARAAAARTPTLRWKACDGGFECSEMTVPLDYREPGGATIELGLTRQPAEDPAHRIGALFVNPGGPGGQATTHAESVAGALPPAVRRRFDIVGVDPRGVGRSEGLDCDQHVGAMYAVDPTVDSDADRAAILRSTRTFVDDCEAAAGPILPHVGTRDSARDIDLARRALGDDQVSFLGSSYGTALGQTYAQLFPRRVRAMVLDGVVDLRLDGVAQARLQALGFEHALGAFARWCRRDPQCPIGADPIGAVDRLTARVERNPVGAPDAGRPAGPADLTLGMTYALYKEQTWPDLALALDRATHGDGDALVGLADRFTQLVEFAPYFAISCLDATWPDADAIFAAGKRAALVAPHFGEATTVDYVRCSLWPVPSQPLTAAPDPGLAPVVVVSTTGDPATPYRSGVALAKQLPGARLVTKVGDDHTAAFDGTRCVDDALADYLVELELPEPGLRCT